MSLIMVVVICIKAIQKKEQHLKVHAVSGHAAISASLFVMYLLIDDSRILLISYSSYLYVKVE